jgi:hypothetical protein
VRTNSADEIACRVILWIADNGGAATVRANRIALGNRRHRVIGALAVNVRLETGKQLVDVQIRENHNVIDRSERADQGGPIGGGKNRPVRPLQRTNRLVIINCHDEPIGLSPCAFQITNVTHVKHIKAAVCQGYRPPSRAVELDKRLELFPRDNLAHGSLQPSAFSFEKLSAFSPQRRVSGAC